MNVIDSEHAIDFLIIDGVKSITAVKEKIQKEHVKKLFSSEQMPDSECAFCSGNSIHSKIKC